MGGWVMVTMFSLATANVLFAASSDTNGTGC